MTKYGNSFRRIATFVSGSHLYGTHTPESDMDIIELIYEPEDSLFGLVKFKPKQEITENNCDMVYITLNHFFEQLYKCAPNMLELLFTTPPYITNHYVWKKVLDNRNLFLNHQKIVKTHIGMTKSCIKQAKSFQKNGDRRNTQKELARAIRVVLQAGDLLEGSLSFPFYDTRLSLLMNILEGRYDCDVIENVFLPREIEHLNKMAVHGSNKDNFHKINDLLIELNKSRFQ